MLSEQRVKRLLEGQTRIAQAAMRLHGEDCTCASCKTICVAVNVLQAVLEVGDGDYEAMIEEAMTPGDPNGRQTR